MSAALDPRRCAAPSGRHRSWWCGLALGALCGGCNTTVYNYYGPGGPPDLAVPAVTDAALPAVVDSAVPADSAMAAPIDASVAADLAVARDAAAPPGDQAMAASYGTCGAGVHTCVCKCGVDQTCAQKCYDANQNCSQCLQDWATNCIAAFCNNEQNDFLNCAQQFNCISLGGLDLVCVKAHCQKQYDTINTCTNTYTFGPKAMAPCHDPYVGCIGTIDPKTGNPVCP